MAIKKEEKSPGGEKRALLTYLDLFLKREKESRQKLKEVNERTRKKIEKTGMIVSVLEEKLKEKRENFEKKIADYRKVKQEIEKGEVKEIIAKSFVRADLEAEEKLEKLQSVIRVKRFEIMKLEEQIAKEKYKFCLWNIDPALSYLDYIRRIKNKLEEGTHQYMYQIPMLHTTMKNAEKEVLLAKGYPDVKVWQLPGPEAVEELFLNPIVNEKHFRELAALIEELREKDLKGKEIMITYRQNDAPDNVSGFKYQILKKLNLKK